MDGNDHQLFFHCLDDQWFKWKGIDCFDTMVGVSRPNVLVNTPEVIGSWRLYSRALDWLH